MKALNPIMLSGKEVLPLIEGGKGVAVTIGKSSGAWAAAGGAGTFSGVNADMLDADGNIIPQEYHATTRQGRHHELITQAIRGGADQARVAHEMSGGEGRIHMNILWEAGGAEEVIHGVLEQVSDLVHGVTCGAGMPYRLAEIAAQYQVYYYPIVSSARAFRALWLRSYKKAPELLGGVVYEDPWRAGGHNGLSNSEDPRQPQDPYPRVLELRQLMNKIGGLDHVPIIMAGGVWCLEEWEDWIDNPELGPIAFQFGTRPLLTQESPIPDSWKQRLLNLQEGDVLLQQFSPTGFWSSAVRNSFMDELVGRSDRQVAYSMKPTEDLTSELPLGPRGRVHYVRAEDLPKAKAWLEAGYTEAMKTPDSTMIFVEPSRAQVIMRDQADCMGCLSQCRFSNWAQNEEGSTGKRADPRSFCIQKTLQGAAHDDNIDHNLMFAGHAAYRFATDPFYANGFIPTVKELVDRIVSGK